MLQLRKGHMNFLWLLQIEKVKFNCRPQQLKLKLVFSSILQLTPRANKKRNLQHSTAVYDLITIT